MTWMQTASGIPFDLLNPRVEDVNRADVIHHLARLARFSGATKAGYRGHPYTVLQHCVLVMDILTSWGAPLAIIREGGWHEVDEPYVGDITRPVQLAVRAALSQLVTLHCGKDLSAEQIDDLATFMDPLHEVRRRVGKVAREAFGLPEVESALVKRADNVALAIERRDLMAPCERDWQLAEYAPPGITIGIVHDTQAIEQIFKDRMRVIEESIG